MKKEIRDAVLEIKKSHLDALRDWRLEKFREPELRTLFLELTRKCNERCLHCGSSCGSEPSPEMSLEELKRFLTDVSRKFDVGRMTLAVTGGEPLLYKDFFPLMEYASSLGFKWGMTTNGTLIDAGVARRLADAGLRTVSISVDGIGEKHDAFRRKKGAYDAAIAGVRNLIEVGSLDAVQITTVVTHDTVRDLPAMFEEFDKLDLDSWRISNVEPIGRALLNSNLMLTPDDYRFMFDFIREKRRDMIPVLYGCQHFLGLDYEREVRDWYWFCSCGTYVASVTCEGNIVGCLDLPRLPELVQGNVRTDDFEKVWKEKFSFFRRDMSEVCGKCSACADRKYCMGGPFHSWDYERNEPLLCFKGTLF